MSLKVPGRSGAFTDMVEGHPNRPTPVPEQRQTLQGRAEGQGSLQGPTAVDRSEQLSPQQQSQEHQSLPNVWDVLEREVRLNAPNVKDQPRWGTQEYDRETDELNRLARELFKRATPRDKLILGIYGAICLEPTGRFPDPVTFRYMSLEEFQQFRSSVEPLSDEQIVEEHRKAEEEYERKKKSMPTPYFPRDSGATV